MKDLNVEQKVEEDITVVVPISGHITRYTPSKELQKYVSDEGTKMRGDFSLKRAIGNFVRIGFGFDPYYESSFMQNNSY